METVNFEDFTRVELRSGTVVRATLIPEARIPAYLVEVDFGPEVGVLKTASRITDLYEAEGLCGKQVIGAVNLGCRQIGPVLSQFLLTGFYREDGEVVLAVPDQHVPDGAKLA